MKNIRYLPSFGNTLSFAIFSKLIILLSFTFSISQASAACPSFLADRADSENTVTLVIAVNFSSSKDSDIASLAKDTVIVNVDLQTDRPTTRYYYSPGNPNHRPRINNTESIVSKIEHANYTRLTGPSCADPEIFKRSIDESLTGKIPLLIRESELDSILQSSHNRRLLILLIVLLTSTMLFNPKRVRITSIFVLGLYPTSYILATILPLLMPGMPNRLSMEFIFFMLGCSSCALFLIRYGDELFKPMRDFEEGVINKLGPMGKLLYVAKMILLFVEIFTLLTL